MFPKISFEGFFLKSCCKYGFDTIKSIQRFGFKHETRCSSEIKPIHPRDTTTIVLVHSNMVIYEGNPVEGCRHSEYQV
jgi:hypothetical protein